MYKLTPQQISQIKDLRAQGYTYYKIGEIFNISFQYAQAVCTSKVRLIPSTLDLPNEEWRIISTLPELEASNYGRIRRIQTKRIYKIQTNNNGYSVVGFSIKSKKYTKLVHRLVAEAFYGQCPKNYTVNHKDGNKSNCKIENLEYITPSQNNKHAYQSGLKSATGEQNGRSKLTESDVIQIRHLAAQGKHYSEIAELFNISYKHANAIINRIFWKHI